MVQVSYPGVYIVEVPSGVHTITGVATSIAAFFGRATKGPLNKAVRILSVADYIRAFGKPHPLSDLAQSVRQFFDNGGTDGYVVRLAQGAQRAAVTLRNLADTQSVLTVTAKTEGLWGNGLRLEIDYNTPNRDDTFSMRVIYEDAGTVVFQEPPFTNLSMNPTSPRFAPTFVSQSSTLVDVALHADMGDPNLVGSFINNPANTPPGYSQGRRPFDTSPLATFQAELTALWDPINPNRSSRFEISVNGEQYVAIDLTGLDVTTGVVTLNDISDVIEAEFNTQLGAAVAGLAVACQWDEIGAAGSNLHVLRITADSGNLSGVRVRRAPANDLASALMLGLDQGGIEVARYSNMRPVFTGSVYVGGTAWGDFTDGIDDLAGVDQVAAGVTGITIAGSPPVNFVLPTAGTNLWYESPAGGFDGVREKLRAIAQAVTGNPAVGWRGEVWGYHLAFIRTGPGSINDTAAVTSAGNAALGNGFVANVRQYALGTIGRSTFQLEQPPGVFGVAGDDGIAPGIVEYLGDELLQTGFHALDSVDLFNLMVIPGDREVTAADHLQLWGPASIYCQSRRAFLLMDAPANWTRNGLLDRAAADPNQLRPGVVTDHAAVFYPRVQFNDAGIRRYIGPSGIIAGLMARIDATRGVWKAPAGIEATLRGVLDLEVNLTDPENGILNKAGANCLRKFPSGLVNWGARTLAGFDDNSNTDWKYIPIRRLALFLEESLYRGTKFVVFEPNDEPLWAKIRLNLNAFMMGLFRQGAFQGSTPDKAFFVKCDGETTTQNDRNLGIVNIEVGFAPLKPAEFVVIYIQQIAGDLT
jgi:phage tail sheath protein FI